MCVSGVWLVLVQDKEVLPLWIKATPVPDPAERAYSDIAFLYSPLNRTISRDGMWGIYQERTSAGNMAG